MFIARRPALLIILIIGFFVVGFFLLLRGCLSKYDERSAIAPSLYFDKDGKSVLFSIVKFEKATSYSQKGNVISKSVSTSYFIQCNDALTGKKLAAMKIKNHRDIRNHPVEVVGAGNGMAWVFIGELMAFDPLTLQQIAGIKILEEKNPSLQGKFPAERRFYVFNRNDASITITATDGSVWKLNTATLVAALSGDDETDDGNPGETRLKKLIQQNEADQDTLMEQKLRQPSRLLARKEITTAQYRKMMVGFNEERFRLFAVRDSLRNLLSKAEKQHRSGEEARRKIISLERTNIHFSQIKANMDTLHGKWYGLYTRQEMEKLWHRVESRAAYGETARRQLFISSYSADKNGETVFDKDNAVMVNASSYFLDGGFLLHKQTGMPVQLAPAAFLVVYKDIIGNERKIRISRIAIDGTTTWTCNTQLKEWADWIITGKQLFVSGMDNKELSSGEVNVLWCIDLATGNAVKYDFFSDK